MHPETLLTLLILGVLSVVGWLALMDEFRKRRIQASSSSDRIFRCLQCSMIYTDDAGVERSRCPQCGKTNDVFAF
jgi:uncharacterized paraquat-inducible protein A